MIIKFQRGGYISSRPYEANLSQPMGKLLSLYQPRPIVDLNANTQNILGVIQTNANIMQNEERLALQRDEQAIQNQVWGLKMKEAENNLLKQQQKDFSDLLAMDDNKFLDADQKLYEEELKKMNADDEYIANTLDFRDSDAVFKVKQNRLALENRFKNAFNNKRDYINLTKELDDLEKSLKLDPLQKAGVLDINSLDTYQNDMLNMRAKIEKLRYEGVNEISSEDLSRIRSYNNQSFIDKAAMENLKRVEEITKSAESKEALADAQYKAMISDLAVKTQNEFITKYPNPTPDQIKAHAEVIDRIKNPSKYLTADAKAAEPSWLEKKKIEQELYYQRDDYSTSSDIRAAAAKGTSAGTADTYTNGTTVIEKGVVKGATYGNIPHTNFEEITGGKIAANGTIYGTKAQLTKLLSTNQLKEMIKSGKAVESGNGYILYPDNEVTPPEGTAPSSPVIRNNNPAPGNNFTTPPKTGIGKYHLKGIKGSN